MIPIKLAMRNFMCYRDNVPPLYFNNIHLACFSGDNGNGKSALIDAMTWALWGQARAKSDDDLIYSGQTEMEVEFEFAVGKQPYRIIRKRARPRRQKGPGQTSLELQIATENGFKPITGNSKIQTQQKITDILHMDYDTFVNSAFLRQGHADEFTTKQPAQRKQVLADILRLSLYDELERQARELARQQETETSQMESTIKEIAAELEQKPIYVAEMERAQSEFSRVEVLLKERETRLNSLRDEKQILEQEKAHLEQLEAHIGETISNLEQWQNQVKQHQIRIKEYEGLINQRPAIEEGYAQFTAAKKACDELDTRFRQTVSLERKQSQLISRIKEAGQSLNTEHALALRGITELETRALKLPDLKNQLRLVQAQSHQLAEQEETLSQKKQSSQELQTRVNSLESHQSQLEREIAEIQEKLSLLSSQVEARCPLCETELGIEGLKLIESKYNVEWRSKTDSLKSNQAELLYKKNELNLLKKDAARLESQLNQQKIAAQSKTHILNKEITEAEEAERQITGERKRLSEIEERLARKDFAAMEQEALVRIELELSGLGYDPQQHEQAQRRLKEMEQYDQSKRKLDEADKLINQEKETVARAKEAAQKLQNNLEADNQKKQALAQDLIRLPGLLGELAEAETAQQALTSERSQAQEALGGIKAKLQRCAELEIRKKEKEGVIAQASKEESIYKELAEAFGKKGIQNLIIETALPEIEAEANRLLARMTDNRMHVKFETQRETKKGGVIETLDINISDELGTRNYEMFSGGEAFRINFAIRIALSRLLAKRAGAPLPTLIIDEGFGTQDSAGIEKLKEAIKSIEDDFEKIFVITHIEELRDAFPTRIDVIKTAEGSTLSVN